LPSNVQAATPSPAARTLVRDLHKIVTLKEQVGWEIDEFEWRSLLPTALSSICRVSTEARTEAKTLLDKRVQEQGGDPKLALQQPGVTRDDVETLMTLWRTQQLLLRGLHESKHCPFWMRQQSDFRGRHSDEGRFSLDVAGGGLFMGRRIGNDYRFGAGGGGRITVGYGVSTHWHLRAGFGFGGGALADSTVETENVAIDYYMDVPLILRHSGVLWRQEVEVAAVTLGIPWKQDIQFGVRVGGLVGLSYLRIRDVMPWAGLVIYGEYIFPRGNLPEAWTVRVGARFGFSWSAMDPEPPPSATGQTTPDLPPIQP